MPLTQRLKTNVKFQAKVQLQRERNAAAKAAQEAAKPVKVARARARAKPKKRVETIASFATNKANFKFFAKYKVEAKAFETLHQLIDQWVDFTLDQIETFCNDEGMETLETKEDVLKLLKRQGLAKNYWEHSGQCHELLFYDESEKLLASEWPDTKEGKERARKVKAKNRK